MDSQAVSTPWAISLRQHSASSVVFPNPAGALKMVTL